MKKIFLIILSILFYFTITYITNILNLFYPSTNILLSSLFIICLFLVYYKLDTLALITYFLFTLVFLFYRYKVDISVSRDFYLFKWVKILFTNKIVLINILGNLVLFMPYVLFIKSKYYIIIILWIILFLELMQYITKRGVFDIVDIYLNICGFMLIIPLRWRFHGRKRQVK